MILLLNLKQSMLTKMQHYNSFPLSILMGTLNELDIIEDTYPVNSEVTTEADVLSEGTVSSRLLSSLIAQSRETTLKYAFKRQKGGTEYYTLGDQTAVLRQHVSAENQATLILSASDLEMDWWKKITESNLHPNDIVIE